MASRKRKKPLTASKNSTKTPSKSASSFFAEKDKNGQVSRKGRLGRFHSYKELGEYIDDVYDGDLEEFIVKEGNYVRRRKGSRETKPDDVFHGVSKKTDGKRSGTGKSRGNPTRGKPSKKKSAKRKSRSRRRVTPERLSAGIQFLDGQNVSGRDPSFNRAVRVRDEILNITTNAAESPRASNNVRLGIDGKTLPIQKRSIAFQRPKKFFETTDENDWGQNPGIESKAHEIYDDLGNGIYFLKVNLGYLDENGEKASRWVSAKRRRIESKEEMDDLLFDMLTTLQISRNTNIYGLLDSGYSFDEIELERLE